MAKVTSPLLSIGAGGQIGKSQVYARWKGIPYARKYVVPKNPKSSGQELTRNAFTWLSAVWKRLPTISVAPWTSGASGNAYSNRNMFMGKNVKALRSQTTLADYIASPGNGGGIPPTSIAITPSAGSLVVAFTNPSVPTGWTLVAAQASCIEAQDPQSATEYTTIAAQDTISQDSVTLDGLAANTTFEVSGWLQWKTASGVTAYSTSINNTGTTS